VLVEKKKIFIFSTSTILKRIYSKFVAAAFFDKENDFNDLIKTFKGT
jgi:hypothetical protein